MSVQHSYTHEEVAKHNSAEDLWVVIDGKVVDVTAFQRKHPGGEEVLLDMAGRDASAAFEDVGHSDDAKALLQTFVLGTINDEPSEGEQEGVENVVSKTEEEIKEEQATAPVEETTEILRTGDESMEKGDADAAFAEAQAEGLAAAIDQQIEENLQAENQPDQPEEQDNEAPAPSSEEKKVDKTTVYSMEEVAKHTSVDDCWLVINGKVVDVTSYLDSHPGGDDVLLEAAGTDATEEFEDIGHSDDAIEQMEKFVIGIVESKPAEPIVESEPVALEPVEDNSVVVESTNEESNQEPEIEAQSAPEPVVEAEPAVLEPVDEPVVIVEPAEPSREVKTEETREIAVPGLTGSAAPSIVVEKSQDEVIKVSSVDKERDQKVRKDKKKIKKEASGVPWGLVLTGVLAVGIVGGFVFYRNKN
eukprot:CAMPEP_0206204830 /NCGR_PEP_ID=MMETSP0166-20121206/13801_1 /ASSEMBLY_ACC=CAM_ASM_000260 /TAXON_ID=95228 /ORGANISM="Vannella robusta, Strain DIVA3 518/3/11/1/6" /LENGTH=416 /DNA_ID=CAMNT_0053624619 /DNA_START=457 /DNA_END=1707 /DNA_ORIENTATION=+